MNRDVGEDYCADPQVGLAVSGSVTEWSWVTEGRSGQPAPRGPCHVAQHLAAGLESLWAAARGPSWWTTTCTCCLAGLCYSCLNVMQSVSRLLLKLAYSLNFRYSLQWEVIRFSDWFWLYCKHSVLDELLLQCYEYMLPSLSVCSCMSVSYC